MSPIGAAPRHQARLLTLIRAICSVADPVGSEPFSRIQIRVWSNFPDPAPAPDPTIKSHITRSKSNKFNRYFCEQFTFFKINQQILKKEDEDKEGEGKDEDEGEDEDEDEDEDKEDGDEDEDEDKEE